MQEFAARRRSLMHLVGQDALVILLGAKNIIRNGDSCFPFRQHSDFFYLTGFCEPDAIALLAPGYPEGEFILFNRSKDPSLAIWHGEIAGQEGAVEVFDADKAYDIRQFWECLPSFLNMYNTIVAPFEQCQAFSQQLSSLIDQLKKSKRKQGQVPQRFQNLKLYTEAMRVIKSPHEIALIRQAVAISVEGHWQCLQHSRAGMAEYELEAMLLQTFYRLGSRASAYPCIVGAGKNACTLHYVSNDKTIKAGDLVLIDAGAEVDCYASDITRTFPINKYFSSPQRAIYELVLLAQQTAIDLLKPGIPWNTIQDTVINVLTTGLCELGLLKGSVVDNMAEERYKRFYMHGAGHYLGLDVHDVGDYKQNNKSRLLEPGMVFTVEPGLYIMPHAEVDERWWHIGIRIEDDVLITPNGCEVLSADLPKKPDDIEAIRCRQ